MPDPVPPLSRGAPLSSLFVWGKGGREGKVGNGVELGRGVEDTRRLRSAASLFECWERDTVTLRVRMILVLPPPRVRLPRFVAGLLSPSLERRQIPGRTRSRVVLLTIVEIFYSRRTQAPAVNYPEAVKLSRTSKQSSIRKEGV